MERSLSSQSEASHLDPVIDHIQSGVNLDQTVVRCPAGHLTGFQLIRVRAGNTECLWSTNGTLRFPCSSAFIAVVRTETFDLSRELDRKSVV